MSSPQADPPRPRHVAFEGPLNFRDIGGYGTIDGRSTRWRRLYRSDGLHRLTTDDLALFNTLGIRTVCDLRGEDERDSLPNPVESMHVPLESLIAADDMWDRAPILEPEQAYRRLAELYLAILRSAGPLIGDLLTRLAIDGLPAVIHCAGGKDRTGITVAILLEALGVPRSTVLDDYELTNHDRTAGTRAEVLELFMASGMSEPGATALLTAPRHVMAQALETLGEEYGGADAYLRNQGKVTSETMVALREQLLE